MTSDPLYSMDLQKDVFVYFSSLTQILLAFIPEDFCGHDETRRLRTELDVTCQQPNIPKGVLKVSELLIGQGLDRGRVDGPISRQNTYFVVVDIVEQ